MKQKVLIAGAHGAILDDFFNHTEAVYSCLSTSIRMNDIRGHIKLFEPDIFVYCLGKGVAEDNDAIDWAFTCLEQIGIENRIIVLLGDKPQYEGVREDLMARVSLPLIKPINIKRIQMEIDKVIEENRIEQEQKALQELRRKQEEEAKRKRHILVVDDDPTMLRTIKMYLEEKYVVATAPSGKFALKFLEQKETDLVLLDYEMPEISGQEVFQKIKDNEKTSNIPVVFLTGISDTSKIRNVLAMLPQGYLLKPVDYDRLHQTINEILFGEEK